MILLIITFAMPAKAQETLLKELGIKANALYQQRRYSEAVKVDKEILKVTEKTFGTDHPRVATSLNNLAGLYRAQGKYGEAAPLCKRSLRILEKALGKDHPDVAESLNNLAKCLRVMGKKDEAEKLEARAKTIRDIHR